MNGSLLRVDGSWFEERYVLVHDTAGWDAAGPALPLLPLPAWLAGLRPARAGVWLAPADDPLVLAPHLGALELIAIEFPKFTDGRGYSSAHLLRTRLGYRGELRAIGDVLLDQLHALARVGFTSFALRSDQGRELASAALRRYSDAYQGAADQPLPAFRRHARAAAGASA